MTASDAILAPAPIAAAAGEILLASASAIRASLLRRAGLAFAVEAAGIDEDEVKRRLRREGAPAEQVAAALAELKAVHVSQRHPQALVIGADQMLECGGAWLDKPGDLDQARAQLLALRGRAHRLISGAALARGGVVLWRHVAEARLEMRPFSDAFLGRYLAAAGSEICASVGGYQLEGLGAQLFARIEGDYFTVLGLPLLPLLAALREHGAAPS
jgi:septum formation protein